VYAGTTKGLYRTTNKGESWERIGQSITQPFISSIVLQSGDPSVIYIGGPGGVWKSADGGKSWEAKNEGLASLNIRALAIEPRRDRSLYAGTNGSGLYRSTDAGATWSALPLKASEPRK
jgi:photosystem II stability/assembly factor-like uncharacterized protein